MSLPASAIAVVLLVGSGPCTVKKPNELVSSMFETDKCGRFEQAAPLGNDTIGHPRVWL